MGRRDALDTYVSKSAIFAIIFRSAAFLAAALYQCEGIRYHTHAGKWRPLRPGWGLSVLVPASRTADRRAQPNGRFAGGWAFFRAE